MKMRYLIVLIVIVALSIPAFGQITWDNNNQQCGTTVNITIPAWAQVVCQGAQDGITFSSSATTGTPTSDGSFDNTKGDWYSKIDENGFYNSIDAGADNKASTEPWAGAEYITGDPDGSPSGVYYEATDYAYHYIRTNTDITGTASCTDLSDGNGHTIPAWFTIAFAPFWNNGSQITVATLPYDGQGAYGADGGGGTIAMAGTTPHGFASATSWNYSITAPAFGTITMHSRILRKGMMDVAGTYTGTITVSYN